MEPVLGNVVQGGKPRLIARRLRQAQRTVLLLSLHSRTSNLNGKGGKRVRHSCLVDHRTSKQADCEPCHSWLPYGKLHSSENKGTTSTEAWCSSPFLWAGLSLPYLPPCLATLLFRPSMGTPVPFPCLRQFLSLPRGLSSAVPCHATMDTHPL